MEAHIVAGNIACERIEGAGHALEEGVIKGVRAQSAATGPCLQVFLDRLVDLEAPLDEVLVGRQGKPMEPFSPVDDLKVPVAENEVEARFFPGQVGEARDDQIEGAARRKVQF